MHTPADGQSNRGSIFVSVISCGLILLVMGLSSCSKSDTPGPSGGGDLDEVKMAATEAMETATEAGADKIFEEDFEKARARFDKAEEYIDEGKEKEAISQYRLAKSAFGRIEKKADEINKYRKEAMEIQKEADAAEKKAREAKADVDAPREFKDALDAYKSAKDMLAALDKRKIQSAGRSFTRAKEYFEEVIDIAKSNRAIRQKAMMEKEVMLQQKAKAIEAKAEKFASSDMLHAGQQERSADIDLESGNFQRAYDAYKMASQSYASAIQQAAAMEAIAKGPTPGNPGGTGPKIMPNPVQPDTPIEPEGPESTDPATDTPDTDVGEVSPPPADEDSLLLANYKKLGLGITNYDPGTGEILIEYFSGSDFSKDIIYPFKNLPKNTKYIKFKDPFMPDLGSGGGRQPKEDVEENPYPFIFTGNTKGYVLIPVPITGDVTIEYGVDLGLMDPNGSLSTVFFAAPNGVSAYGVNFITIWTRNSSGNTKPFTAGIRNPKWRRSPNGWFSKLKTMMMRIEMIPHPKKEESRVLQVIYNADEEENPANLLAMKPGKSGYVGFEWNRVRFNIRALRIKGILDKEAALELLAAKGIKVSAAPPAKESSKSTKVSTKGTKKGTDKEGGEEFGF